MRILTPFLLVLTLGLGIVLGRVLPDGNSEARGAEPVARAGAATPERPDDRRDGAESELQGDLVPAPPEASAAPPAAVVPSARETAAVSPTEGDAAESEPPAPTPEALAAALESFLAAGVLERRFADDPHGLATFLAGSYLAIGEPYEAWDLVHAWPDLAGQYLPDIGLALKQQGDLAGATEALLEAAQLSPWDSGLTDQLAELDPAGALALLREAMVLEPELAENGGIEREVRLLLASGQTEEALDRIEDLLAGEWIDPSAWDLLSELPPELAEERLRAHAGDDAYGDARYRLAQLLEERGDQEGAIEVLEELLREAPGRWEALWMLGNLDRDACIAALTERVAYGADAETWNAFGDQLEAAGRHEEAIDAWLSAFELYPSDSSYGYKLLEHAPERFFSTFEEHTRRSGDDEMWGDLADAYWRAGRQAEAKESWQRARQLDPDDGEWSGKLQSLAAGNDPLGGGMQIGIGGFGTQILSDLGYLGYSTGVHEEIDFSFD